MSFEGINIIWIYDYNHMDVIIYDNFLKTLENTPLYHILECEKPLHPLEIQC